MTPCNHDYHNYVRKGRARYHCPKCDADITLTLVMLAEANDKPKFKRGPIKTTTGMIRVRVQYQHDEENRWVARVQGHDKLHQGPTKDEAIRKALQGASEPPITKKGKKV